MSFSLNINPVKSLGNPNVSYSSKTSDPETNLLLLFNIISFNFKIPFSKVLKNEASSSLIIFSIISTCPLISGNAVSN